MQRGHQPDELRPAGHKQERQALRRQVMPFGVQDDLAQLLAQRRAAGIDATDDITPLAAQLIPLNTCFDICHRSIPFSQKSERLNEDFTKTIEAQNEPVDEQLS